MPPFKIAETRHGPLILSELDYVSLPDGRKLMGVGKRLQVTGTLDREEIGMGCRLLDWKREAGGDGCLALDVGANIGVMTIEWARHMKGWGRVLAFEMQRQVSYVLGGNVMLANCFNVEVHHAVVSNVDGEIAVPLLDFNQPANIGGLGLQIADDVGQRPAGTEKVRTLRVDSLHLTRLDLIKIDVEGAEVAVLEGAQDTLRRLNPYIMAERLKCSGHLEPWLEHAGYRVVAVGNNVIAIPADDPNCRRLAHSPPTDVR